ncbi:uncharacterized protein LOC117172930 [Belonocnema kinseyi]|uniref:uncharacterized protein LOC117172930 n=1 Tax=Belonocnema kinseyi TaxID=2817044 RepID=UPI00143DF91B|nr:uncharacterized protein LOC117172930 [Belonocnema kinseyi]
MAFFRSVIQILSVNTIKNPGRSVDLLDKCPKWGSEICTINRRSLWTQKKSESKLKCSNCKKLSDNPLISKGEPSKSLEDQNNIRKRNCEEVIEPCKKKESFWSYLFGGLFGDDKKAASIPVPDPSTCRLAHKFKEKCRKEDPRLCDPRYSATPGDVFLFTEFPKPSSSTSSSLEPQPQPPPPYKIPSAVICKRIADAVAEHTCVHFSLPKSDDCKGDKCLEPKPFRLPYAEFRPTIRPREPFICADGKRGEDVLKPIRKEMYPCGFPSLLPQYIDPGEKISKKFFSCPSNSEDESDWSDCKSRKKLSRIDRLKKLTAGKQGMYHPIC